MTVPTNRTLIYKRWLWLAVVVFIGIAVAYRWQKLSTPEEQDTQQFLEVFVGDIEENVTAQGKLEIRKSVV